MEAVRYIGASTHKGNTPLQPAACSKCVLALLLDTAIFAQCSVRKCHVFLQISPGQYSSATSRDFFKALEIPLHSEQLKRKSIVQMAEPDGREEDHSHG